MKKIILILLLILAGLAITLSMLGSRGEYAAEKLYYSAMKTINKLDVNPDVVPPKLIDAVASKMKKILQKYPDTDIAKTTYIKLAEFYIGYKKYDQALVLLNEMIKKYNKNTGILSMSHFLKGLVHEKQNKWSQALDEYQIVRDDYRDTKLGMEIPLYIANYYSKKGADAAASQAYNDAALFYKKLEKENNGKMLGYISSVLLIQTYFNAGDYEQAGNVLGDTFDKYKSVATLNQLLPQVEIIYVNKLKQPEKAVEIYKNIQKNYPNDKLKKILQKRIEELEAKK